MAIKLTQLSIAVLISGLAFLERHESSSKISGVDETSENDVRSDLYHPSYHRSILPPSRLLVSLAHPCIDCSHQGNQLDIEEAELSNATSARPISSWRSDALPWLQNPQISMGARSHSNAPTAEAWMSFQSTRSNEIQDQCSVDKRLQRCISGQTALFRTRLGRPLHRSWSAILMWQSHRNHSCLGDLVRPSLSRITLGRKSGKRVDGQEDVPEELRD